uniref:CCN family member 5 n=1 Tax=Jaculus jaculus TaxID=51337 RepID=A0A8C5KBN8_JACJA
MKATLQTRLLAISFICLLSEVYAQQCQTPCVCPWTPPQCPPGVPLALDGCGCCLVCARQLGESCDHRHVCDTMQGLVCQPGAGPSGLGAVCLLREDNGSCEVDGRLYQEGETFQPSCRTSCRCEDGGVTCLPLCHEDVRLPSADCPHPRRVEIPGRCCPEWVCSQGAALGNWPYAAQGRQIPGLAATSPAGIPCPEWSTAWGPCSTTCGLGLSTRVSNQNSFCRLETQHRLCLPRLCPPPRGRRPWDSAF